MRWFEHLKTQIQWFQAQIVVFSLQMVYMPQVCAYTSHVEPPVSGQDPTFTFHDTSEIWQLHQLVGWSQQKSQEFEVFEFFVHPKISWGFPQGLPEAKLHFPMVGEQS